MVSIILKNLIAVATKMLISVASRPVIEWAFIYIARKIVETTKTPHDDEFLKKVLDAYREGNKEFGDNQPKDYVE